MNEKIDHPVKEWMITTTINGVVHNYTASDTLPNILNRLSNYLISLQ